MPYLRVETNVPQEQISADLPAKLCKALSTSLGKPLSYCVASVTGGVAMSWGGTDGPCAQATLSSIGALSKEKNKAHSKILYEIICKDLKIQPDKMYIFFHNAGKEDVGFNGTTFDDFL